MLLVGAAREQMIDAAERLAAAKGLAAISLREVQTAAGQRNKSAAQYHFGSKEGLVEAVVASRMGAIGARRRQMLDGLDDAPSRRDLVAVLVVPLAEHVLAGDSHWARFQVQAAHDPVFAQIVRLGFEASAYREVRSGLVAGLDHVPPALRERRFDHAIGLVVTSLAALEGGHTAGSISADAAVADLVDMAVGVLDAPVSAETAAALEGSARALA